MLSEGQRRELERVYRIILSIRRSYDPPFVRFKQTEEYEKRKRLLSDFEGLRLAFRSIIRPSTRNPELDNYFIDEITRLTDSIYKSTSFERSAHLPLKAIPSINRPTSIDKLIIDLANDERTIGESFDICRQIIKNIAKSHDPLTEFSPERFNAIIPPSGLLLPSLQLKMKRSLSLHNRTTP